jgi:hypothetical protein
MFWQSENHGGVEGLDYRGGTPEPVFPEGPRNPSRSPCFFLVKIGEA